MIMEKKVPHPLSGKDERFEGKEVTEKEAQTIEEERKKLEEEGKLKEEHEELIEGPGGVMMTREDYDDWKKKQEK